MSKAVGTVRMTISVEPALREAIDAIAARDGKRNRSATCARLMRVGLSHEPHRVPTVVESDVEEFAA